ncbi:MAG TPA: hypothetical protein VM925_35725, partial [Labilithrix sp.]|nr:hypothetical protein [Labilithrix sp.]
MTEKFGVFVSNSGTPDGEGTRDRPVSSISRGIELARATAKRVYVCKGKYKESVVLANAVSVIGGYDCSAKWSNDEGERSTLEAPTSPALLAKDIVNDTSLIGFDVIAPDATPANTSSIGLIAQNAKHLAIVRTKITAGDALDGTPGTTPSDETNGPEVNGGSGAPGYGPGDYPPGGPVRSKEGRGARGVSHCGGGPGGWGGSGGFYACARDTTSAAPRYLWTLYRREVAPVDDPWFSIPPVPGETTMTGANGGAGADGTSARNGGLLGPQGYTPANGTAGTDGAGGDGGSGGSYAFVGGLCESST